MLELSKAATEAKTVSEFYHALQLI